MEIFIFWLLLSGGVGAVASARGRSGVGWFFISAIISPILGFVLAVILPNRKMQGVQPSPETHVKCPDCRELVLNDARKCKHCGCSLVPKQV